MIDATDPPSGGNYEAQLAAWAKAKIASGIDADVVNARVGDLVHAYRRSLANKPLAEEPETAGEKAAGAISSAYQGLTLGAGNKITAAIRTALPESLGGEPVAESGSVGETFHNALGEQTKVQEDFQGRHPVASRALEVAGSLPTVLVTGGAGAAGDAATASRVARIGKIVKQGAGYGATSGALSANRLEDVAPGAVTGAAEGAVLAPIAGALGSIGARGAVGLARKVLPANAGVTLGRLVGSGATTADEQAQGAIAGALRKGGVDLAADVPTHSPTTAMEMGSRNVPALVRQARNVPTSDAAQITDRFLNERAAGAGRRVEEGLATGTGHTPTDVQEPIEQLIERRAQEAKPLYDQAYEHGEIKNPDTIAQINALRKHPDLKAAWERGQRLRDLEQPPAPANGLTPERFAELQAQGLDKYLPEGLQPKTGVTVAQVDAWKKGLDAMIESRAGSGNALSRSEARLYRQKLNGVLDMVDEEVPAYAKARASFRGNSELMDAAQSGADHFKPSTSADYLKRTLPELSDGEQEAYRANALNAAIQKVRGMGANEDLPEAARGTNIVQRLFGTHEAGQKLRMLFPDEGSYNEFLSKMEQEALYPKTQKFLQGQSTTAAQLAESGTSPSTWRDAGIAATTGSPFAKARLLTSAVRNLTGAGRGMRPEVADAIARHATQTGDQLQSLLRVVGERDAQRIGSRQRLAGLLSNTVAAQPSP